MTAPVEVGILREEGSLEGCVHGMTDLLLFADGIARGKSKAAPPLRISHWAVERKKVRRVFDTLPDAATDPRVVILGSSRTRPIPTHRGSPFIDWLRAAHGRGATLAAVCGGAFLLAETGLLAGRRATTHWQFSQEFSKRFPDVLVESESMLIDHGDLVTAGGVMAWTDLGLRLTERLLGEAVMFDTARFMLLDPPRREQRFYGDFAPKMHHGDAPIAKVQTWLNGEREGPVSIDAMARRAGLERRTFLRRFVKATGLRPTEYHHHLRMARARDLLERSQSSVDEIAAAIGYEDAGGFRRIFKKVIGLTPSDYRRRFGQTCFSGELRLPSS